MITSSFQPFILLTYYLLTQISGQLTEAKMSRTRRLWLRSMRGGGLHYSAVGWMFRTYLRQAFHSLENYIPVVPDSYRDKFLVIAGEAVMEARNAKQRAQRLRVVARALVAAQAVAVPLMAAGIPPDLVQQAAAAAAAAVDREEHDDDESDQFDSEDDDQEEGLRDANAAYLKALDEADEDDQDDPFERLVPVPVAGKHDHSVSPPKASKRSKS